MKKILLISIPGAFFLNTQAGHAHDDPKKAALTVLEQKCNVCHRINNPGRVFTIDNMEGLAPKIYKQVFVKRRMPKGNTIRLTEEESEVLKNWVETKMQVSR
jgi:uncharacterized membrane protein